MLKEGAPWLHIGIRMRLKNPSLFFNLDSYDSVKIKIQADKNKYFMLRLRLFVKDISKIENTNSYLIFQDEINVDLNQDYYTLYFDDFNTPIWWYEFNKFSVNSNFNIDFSQITDIEIVSHIVPYSDMDTLTLKKLIFHKTTIREWLFCLLLVLGYYLFYYLRFLYRKHIQNITNRMLKATIPYEFLEMESYIDKDSKKNISVISELYTDPELNISKLSSKTNQQVLEIALSVGYNNITYFNRVFKKLVGVAPNQFKNIKYKMEK